MFGDAAVAESVKSPACIQPATDDEQRSGRGSSKHDSPPFSFPLSREIASPGLLSDWLPGVLPFSPMPVSGESQEVVTEKGGQGERVSEKQQEALPVQEGMAGSDEARERQIPAESMLGPTRSETPYVASTVDSAGTAAAPTVEAECAASSPVDLLAIAMAEIQSPVPCQRDQERAQEPAVMLGASLSVDAPSSAGSKPKRKKKTTGQKSEQRGDYFYQCDRCHRGYITAARYQAHQRQCQAGMEEAKRKKAHKPETSSAMVSQPPAITQPEGEENPIGEWACHLCGKMFCFENTLKIHLSLHDQYQSGQIPEKFSVPGEREEKPSSQDTDQTVKCGICGEIFWFESTLQYHMLDHDPRASRQGYERSSESIRRAVLESPALRREERLAGITERAAPSSTGGSVKAEAQTTVSLNIASQRSQCRYCCSLCHEYFATERLLKNHIQLHFMTGCNPLPEHLKVPIPRLKPQQKAATSSQAKKEPSIVSPRAKAAPVKTWKCAICDQMFSTHVELAKHGKDQHSDKRLKLLGVSREDPGVAVTSIVTSSLTTHVAASSTASVAGLSSALSPQPSTSTHRQPMPSTPSPAPPPQMLSFDDIASVGSNYININEPDMLLIPMSPGLSTPPPPALDDEDT
ncbi:hypothetical protein [Kistimonas asteriae]|uniref:hypothetical protein n=1 Tax=Kistimonas asteriae TaxID=517724 RepID=UPI001BA83C5A|nr:hypothetical protein [Kistimonas asteriae]